MNKNDNQQSGPKPDEPKPERPMQPVMEKAPEPDPKLRAERPEKDSSEKRTDQYVESEQERLDRLKKQNKK